VPEFRYTITELVFDQRGAENRLGLAVSLCAPRFLGFVPDKIASIPDEALGFVAPQVDAEAHELLAYGAFPRRTSPVRQV
jgi:hypothetical protein